jgi:hypothetical protein
MQLWQQDREQWAREEGLADLGAGVVGFVGVPPPEVGEGERVGGKREGFWGRIGRQVVEAKVSVFLGVVVVSGFLMCYVCVCC